MIAMMLSFVVELESTILGYKEVFCVVLHQASLASLFKSLYIYSKYILLFFRFYLHFVCIPISC